MFHSPRQALCSGFITAVPLKTDIFCSMKQQESIPSESKWLKCGDETYCKAVGEWREAAELAVWLKKAKKDVLKDGLG